MLKINSWLEPIKPILFISSLKTTGGDFVGHNAGSSARNTNPIRDDNIQLFKFGL